MFHSFNDELDYALAHYFAESETTKDNVDKFFSNPLMRSINEKLSYRNADEWMEKLSNIRWGVPDVKWIKLKFQLKNRVNKVAGQKLTIQLRNVIDCLGYFMGHPEFANRQTHQPSLLTLKHQKHAVTLPPELHFHDGWL